MSTTPPLTSGDEAATTTSSTTPTLSPLEQDVLDEYARLVGNMNNLSALLADLAANPSAAILDALRGLERKTSLVFTLLKASVYSIVLQQQIYGEEEEGGGDGGQAGRFGNMGDGGDVGDAGEGEGGMTTFVG